MGERNDLIDSVIDASADQRDQWFAERGVTTDRAKWKARALAAEATIASLSEALAEVEKKTLDRAAVYVEKFGDWRMEIGLQHKQDPHTGQCAAEQFWLREAAKGIRDLSQGGQP